MAGLRKDHTGNTVLIYDSYGNHIKDTVVASHDKVEQHMQVRSMPAELNVNDDCRLFILTSPKPYEYQGKVRKIAGKLHIALFQGHEMENRAATRYSVNTQAIIDALFVDGKLYKLHTEIEVELINISTGGVRFRAPLFSFNVGNTFQMHLVISGNRKELITQVLNHVDKEPDSSDYGCRFLDKSSQMSEG